MNRYIIRVELNGSPSATVYDKLHDAMGAARTARTILGDDGNTYVLPNATYFGRSQLSAVDVRDLILSVVEPIWADCDVLAVDYNSAAWQLHPLPPGALGLRRAA